MLDKRKSDRVKEILEDPSLFPDTFKNWIAKAVEIHPTFTLPKAQLPVVDRAHNVGATGEPAFQNSWVNEGGGYAPATFYRDPFNRVHLGGVVQSGTAGTTIFTLPPAYRPTTIVAFRSDIDIDVNPDGTVEHVSGVNTFVPLDGLSFRV